MTLVEKLTALGFDEGDFEVQKNKGSPEFIKVWYSQTSMPTEEQLNAITQEQIDSAKKEKNFKKDFEANNRDKAIVMWIAGLHGLSLGQAKKQIKDILDTL